jgi:hypothetical protein
MESGAAELDRLGELIQAAKRGENISEREAWERMSLADRAEVLKLLPPVPPPWWIKGSAAWRELRQHLGLGETPPAEPGEAV